MQMDYDWNTIIDSGKKLGIRLTDADIDSQLAASWADRVLEAEMHMEMSKYRANAAKEYHLRKCQEMIEAANQYAI